MRIQAQTLFGLIVFSQVFTSSAQVFNSKGVGYYNVTLVPGYNLVANQLITADNSIGVLFKNFQGGVPDGTIVYKFVNGNFISASYIELTGSFEPADVAAETIGPGEGVFVYIPVPSNRVLTFAGAIPQGQVCTPVPHGFSIKSNLLPRSETLAQMGFPFSPGGGDVVYVYSPPTRNYMAISYIPLLGGWDSPQTIKVGEAFFVYRTGSDTTWCRPPGLDPPVRIFEIQPPD